MSEFYASKAIEVAKSQIGYCEKRTNSQLDSETANAGYGNFTKYARDIDKLNILNDKKQGYDWCAIFVLWVMLKAFGKAALNKLLYGLTYAAGCTATVNYYKKAGKFFDTPKVGDQIFFRNSSGNPCHTGLVSKVTKTHVYTIEGNTSSESGVVANGGCVEDKIYPLQSSYIYGYGRPNYDPEPKKKKKELDTTGYKLGDKSIGVLALKQTLLQAYKLGIITIKVKNDKGYGKGTVKAVNQVLKQLGYKKNGIAGEKFIKKLGNLIREGKTI